MRISPATIFALFIVAVTGWAVWVASTYYILSGLFPMIIGSFTVLMCLSFVVKESITEGAMRRSSVPVDIEPDHSVPIKVRLIKGARVFAWFMAVYPAIWLLGFKLAVVLFFAAYLIVEARAKWFTILGLMALLVVVLFLFGRVLEVFWLEGLLNQWLQEPLPWLF